VNSLGEPAGFEASRRCAASFPLYRRRITSV